MHGIMVLVALLGNPDGGPLYSSRTIDIGVVVTDIEASLAFYREVLGFEPATSPAFDVSAELGKRAGLTDDLPFRVHVLKMPGEGPGTKLKLMTFADLPEPPKGTYLHSAVGVRYLTLFVKDVGSAVARAREAGANILGDGPVPIQPTAAAGTWIALVTDPDGNLIELVGPRSEAGFQPLFNGEDLTDWRSLRNGVWEVRDGTIVGRQSEGNKGGWLITKKTFGDFDLRVRFRISPGGNSGVACRFPEEGSPAQQGYEMQVGDADPRFLTGSVFGLEQAPAGILREGEWQSGRLVAEGNRITTYIDGKRICSIEDGRASRGHIGFQVHGGAQYDGIRVEYRDVRILEK